MRVLFFSPSYPPEMVSFAKALAEVGATVIGVIDSPPAANVRPYISDYVVVKSLLDESSTFEICLDWLRKNSVERIISNWEPTMMLAARLRENVGLPGMSTNATLGFRDKTIMRARAAAAGIRIPKTIRVATKNELWSAVECIGFPLIVKPVAGAGSSNTHRLNSMAELEAIFSMLEGQDVLSVEEFIDGEERTFETLSVNGSVQFEAMSTYAPACLVARQHEHISPIIQTFRHMERPDLVKGRQLGHAVLQALGMGTGYTHMEWFLTRSGEAVFGEVACRSPGANMVDLINYAGDIDTYRGWALAQVFNQVPKYSPTPYSAAIIFKRASGNGQIQQVYGLADFMRRYGEHVARVDLLPIGALRRNWQQTFLSDGNIVIRHPQFDITRALAEEFARAVKLVAG